VAILLGGVLAKLGTYGLVRFGLGCFGNLGGCGRVSDFGAIAVYGHGDRTKDIKRMVAYSSIGHMGYVLLELPPLHKVSLVGAVLKWLPSLAILFHLVGVIEQSWYPRLGCPQWFDESRAGLPLISALLVLGAWLVLVSVWRALSPRF